MPEVLVDAVISNRRGLHARAAAKLAALAETLGAEVFITFEGQRVSALSIMGLMLLGAGLGATITISAEGANAEGAVERAVALVKSGFAEVD